MYRTDTHKTNNVSFVSFNINSDTIYEFCKIIIGYVDVDVLLIQELMDNNVENIRFLLPIVNKINELHNMMLSDAIVRQCDIKIIDAFVDRGCVPLSRCKYAEIESICKNGYVKAMKRLIEKNIYINTYHYSYKDYIMDFMHELTPNHIEIIDLILSNVKDIPYIYLGLDKLMEVALEKHVRSVRVMIWEYRKKRGMNFLNYNTYYNYYGGR
jgi:hypothetical protein